MTPHRTTINAHNAQADAAKPKREPAKERTVTMVEITIESEETGSPVPSHGGPMRGIWWYLKVAGVDIASEFCRTAWDYKGTMPPPPSYMYKLKAELEAALSTLPIAREGKVEDLRLAAASIREWMPETLPADEHGKVHFARALAESAAEAIEVFLSQSEHLSALISSPGKDGDRATSK